LEFVFFRLLVVH